MPSRVFIAEIKWAMLAFIVSIILVGIINITIPTDVNCQMQNTFFGLNTFLEILVFFAFNTFVVFSIKSNFESLSHKFADVIIFSFGIILALVINILAYQILS
jgi:hypothetical protein